VKYYLSLFILLLLSGLILISCDDNPTNHHGNDAVVFPNHVGDTWTYEIHDSTAATYDTVVVTIVGTYTMANGHRARVWEYQYLSRAESNYVDTYGNIVNIYSDKSTYAPIDKYVFPLHVGDYWEVTGLEAPIEVMERGPVSTKAGDFDTSYRIRKQWSFIDDFGAIDSWFVAYRGIVKIATHRSAIDGLHVQFWELLSYNVHLPGI